MTAGVGLHVDRVPHAVWSSSALISVQTSFMRVKTGFANPVQMRQPGGFPPPTTIDYPGSPPYGVGV